MRCFLGATISRGTAPIFFAASRKDVPQPCPYNFWARHQFSLLHREKMFHSRAPTISGHGTNFLCCIAKRCSTAVPLQFLGTAPIFFAASRKGFPQPCPYNFWARHQFSLLHREKVFHSRAPTISGHGTNFLCCIAKRFSTAVPLQFLPPAPSCRRVGAIYATREISLNSPSCYPP